MVDGGGDLKVCSESGKPGGLCWSLLPRSLIPSFLPPDRLVPPVSYSCVLFPGGVACVPAWSGLRCFCCVLSRSSVKPSTPPLRLANHYPPTTFHSLPFNTKHLASYKPAILSLLGFPLFLFCIQLESYSLPAASWPLRDTKW
jgi:hypothetical protein